MKINYLEALLRENLGGFILDKKGLGKSESTRKCVGILKVEDQLKVLLLPNNLHTLL